MAAQVYPNQVPPPPPPPPGGQIAGPMVIRPAPGQPQMQQQMHPGGAPNQAGKQNAKDPAIRGPNQQLLTFPDRFPTTYHGWILKKCPLSSIPAGEKPSWRWAGREELPVSANEYMRNLNIKKKSKKPKATSAPMDVYRTLRSDNQKKQISRLLQDQRQKEPNPHAQWMLAHIECEVRKLGPGATDIASMTVILKKESKVPTNELMYEFDSAGNQLRVDVGARPDFYYPKDNRSFPNSNQGFQQQMQNLPQNMNGGQQQYQQAGAVQGNGQGKQNANVSAQPQGQQGFPPQPNRGQPGPPPPGYHGAPMAQSVQQPGRQPAGPAPLPPPPQQILRKSASRGSQKLKQTPGARKSAQKVSGWLDEAETDSDFDSASSLDLPAGKMEGYKTPKKKISISALHALPHPPMGKHAHDIRNDANYHGQPPRKSSQMNLRGGGSSRTPLKRVTTTVKEFASSSPGSSRYSNPYSDDSSSERGHRRYRRNSPVYTPSTSFGSEPYFIEKGRGRATYNDGVDPRFRDDWVNTERSGLRPKIYRDAYYPHGDGEYDVDELYPFSDSKGRHHRQPIDIVPHSSRPILGRSASVRGPHSAYRYTTSSPNQLSPKQPPAVVYPPRPQGQYSSTTAAPYYDDYDLPASGGFRQEQFREAERKRIERERMRLEQLRAEQETRHLVQDLKQVGRENDYEHQRRKEHKRRSDAELHMYDQQIRDLEQRQAELSHRGGNPIRRHSVLETYPGRTARGDW